MPTVAASVAELLGLLAPAATVADGRLVIDDEAAFRSTTIRDLAWTAAFATDEATVEAARWLVWEASQELGARSASIQELYVARARGEVDGFTVPAINLRAQTFDMARIDLRDRRGRRRRRGDPRAGPQRADLHLPAPDRLRDQRPGRRDRRRLAGTRSSSRATTTSSTPRSTQPTRRR